MPSKLQFYSAFAERTARQITGSYRSWTAFLATAARLYKYPYNEQLMIYAQRPNATACAEYDFWKERMGRYVQRGSTGIALIDTSGYQPRLRYVFDVADTAPRDAARSFTLWEMRAEHEAAVSAMLTEQYDIPQDGGIIAQFERVADKLALEYWTEQKRDICDIVADSFLNGYDEDNIRMAFKTAASTSITYALMARCGFSPDGYFEPEDFMPVFDFNTPAAVSVLGTAVSEISQRVLRQIEITVKDKSANAAQKGRKNMENNLTYKTSGEFQIPDLSLRENPQSQPLGKYGRMRQTYLREHRPILWNQMILTETLFPHLREIDEAANRRLEQMMPNLMKSAGVTEALKAADPLKWTGLMNTCKAQAEEVILAELIYA